MLKPIYKIFHKYGSELTPNFYAMACDNKFLIKYVISGLTATVIDLSLLVFLTEYVFTEKYYLESAVIAFLSAFSFSFLLQKFWTFKDSSTSNLKGQLSVYLSIAVMNLFLNTILVYFFVEYLGIWYLFAQILAGAIISFQSLILYIRFVFSKTCSVGDKSILIASGIFPPDGGGPSTHSYNFLKGFIEKGIKTAVLTYSDVDKYPDIDDKNPVMRVSRKLPLPARGFFYLVKLFSASVEFEVIYAQDVTAAGLPAMIVTKLLNRKFYLRIGGDLLWERMAEKGKTDLSFVNFYKRGAYKKRWLFYISRIVMRSADKIIVPSELLSEIYEKYYGIHNSKIFILKNPIPNIIKIGTETENKKERMILFAGRFVKYKNLANLIDGFSKIAGQFPDARLSLVGKGPEFCNLKKRSMDLDIEKDVIFEENMPHDRLMDKISSSSICVAPALTEFNPNFILECLSYKKPVLISRENGLSIKLPDEFILEKGDALEISKKIKEILDNEVFYKEKIIKVLENSPKITLDDIINKQIELFFDKTSTFGA